MERTIDSTQWSFQSNIVKTIWTKKKKYIFYQESIFLINKLYKIM